MRLLAAVLMMLWPVIAQAEPYPAPADLAVNDFADLLSPEAEARLGDTLDTLRRETGIEATMLTLPDRNAYDAAPSLEAFATRLFNGWGIGDATRNDGILILVLPENREMRIELGAGYNPEYDIPAQDIVNRVMLPAFRDGRMEAGIEEGTQEVIAQIARRHAAGLAPEAPARKTGESGGKLIALLVGAGMVVLALRRRAAGLLARFRRCPNCHHRGLRHERITTRAASRDMAGQGITRDSCPTCNWRQERSHTIPRRRPGRGGGSFGGGRSSGGGASGRW